ncbi:hypothetical protein [Nonomuraea rhodomycinica]|uniref:Uncharacterized protein n=1 Tax=Nonomuraea rhodomycinica TaxID=1712872 RepID=A0A7Y6J0T3_9ACTN|nr:hypothetical protein [Nonomuraea rhodomycinica]NUW46614.1 hypothetical protein [Nonomuraea rhodomycinica]
MAPTILMAADSEFPPELVDKQVALYAAIDKVAEIVAAEPKPPEGEALTAEQRQALDDALAEHRVALEQARATQSKALDEESKPNSPSTPRQRLPVYRLSPRT